MSNKLSFAFLAQIIINYLRKSKKNNFVEKILFNFLLKFRDLVTPFYDPDIFYRIGKRKILIPFSHNLPIYINKYPGYVDNLIRAVMVSASKWKNFKMIDVGANVGDSAVIIKNKIEIQMLCIEPDDKYFELLEKNVSEIRTVRCEKIFLGSEDGISNLELETNGGTGNLERKETNTNIGVNLHKLDTYLKIDPEFLTAKFIKVDTDGYDFLVLKGSKNFIKKSKPVIFFEYDPNFFERIKENGENEFLNFLRGNGYQKALLYDNFGRFMLSIDTGNKDSIEEIRNYVTRNNRVYFLDICVFHKNDTDLFNKLRNMELNNV